MQDRLSTYEQVVEAYLTNYARAADRERRFYADQPTLREAIQVAALSIDPEGNRHVHQRRIRRGLLPEAERRLQQQRHRLEACTSFSDLFATVCEIVGPINGIGRHGVTPYDFAARIGAKRRLSPEHVYLHNGTAKGARALGIRGATIPLQKLPKAFQKLTPAQADDCLCIYKDQLRRIASRA